MAGQFDDKRWSQAPLGEPAAWPQPEDLHQKVGIIDKKLSP